MSDADEVENPRTGLRETAEAFLAKEIVKMADEKQAQAAIEHLEIWHQIARAMIDGWSVEVSYHDDKSGPPPWHGPKVYSVFFRKFIDNRVLTAKGRHALVKRAVGQAWDEAKALESMT